MRISGRRVGFLVVVAALTAAVVSAVTTDPVPPAPPPDREVVKAAPDEASAVLAAYRQGTKVEVLSERTGTRTVFAHPDGTHSAKITAVPTRLLRGGR